MAKVWRRKSRGKRETWIVDYRDATGVRHRLTANTREEADGLLAEKVNESREGHPATLAADRDIAVAEYGARWLGAIATELKRRTVVSYEQLFRLHLEPTIGGLRLCEIQRAHVKALIASKRQTGLSKNTVRLIRACLSAMLAEAADDGLIKANPAASLSRRPGRRSGDALTRSERVKTIRPLSEQQLVAMLDAAREDADYFPVFLTLARTGLRPGEALALKWEDVNLSDRVITVERALSAGEIGTTKTGHVRRVDMSLELAAALAKLYVGREKETLRRGWPEMPTWVFINRQGRLLDESRLRKRFARILKRAGLSGFRVYDLRHTFATLLLAKGVPITYVAAQLGHSKPTTTLQWYAHWLPSESKNFVDSLDSPQGAAWHRSGTDAGSSVQEPKAEGKNVAEFQQNFGGPSETRTPDPLIKSQLLYQLS